MNPIRSSVLSTLVLFHIAIITASNYLVQLPINIFGFHTTWGAFSFPLIFIATDLSVRLLGADLARQVIWRVMLPALLVSYLVSVLFFQGQWQGWQSLQELNTFVARIAAASFAAYLLGQLLDISVFNRLRQISLWWVAPLCSTLLGNLVDTFAFFGLAFAGSSDEFMRQHWVEIAWADYGFKLLISVAFSLPLYALVLGRLQRWLQPAALTPQQA
ncbi:7-cyano-7-deazaguanine/7-aminomethyl-7-deazaguanine transporter [Balneatrix alpica]|uniref:Probable queuosine precursor transporter n=1 Tax=Balneatrix alpica TaxID=75684 RepID=A0ABV5Z9B4_9GAMM|nr:7-cyano-7-deazaguanine/7-aminomethyl-7-deazaguanine transporter [Balneatrix alpica]